jgi:uncharacterized protein YdaU (DUF1376 family)
VNYYSRNLGDYAKDAGYLSALGHGIYTLLMDWYYGAERPIPHEDAHDIAKVSPEEVAPILRKFFQRDGDVWRHKRIDAEIAAYQAKESASLERKAGETERQRRHRERRAQLFAELRDHGVTMPFDAVTSDLVTELSRVTGALCNAIDTAITINQEPITKKEQKPPYIPQGGNEAGEQPTEPKPKAVTLKTYLAECEKAGTAPVPEDDAVWRHADATGLPDEFLHLAWGVFESRYVDTSQRQAAGRGWRQKFRNAVEGNWFKLWYMNGSGWELTTAGKQAKLAHGGES